MSSTANLTDRQKKVLQYVRAAQVVGSGYDRSVLEALERKGLVLRSQMSAPGYIYYNWSLTAAGSELALALRGVR